MDRATRARAPWRRALESWPVTLLVAGLLAWGILSLPGVRRSPSNAVLASEGDLRGVIAEMGLGAQLYFLRPSDLGVTDWRVGDFARYAYRCDGPQPSSWDISPEVAFEVVGETHGRDRYGDLHGRAAENQHWVRGRGFASYRQVRGDDYRLVVPDDLRITIRTPSFHVIDRYFPIRVDLWDDLDAPRLELEHIGREVVATPVGELECDRWRGTLLPGLPPLEVWSNPELRPFGIARLELGAEALALLEFGRGADFHLEPAVAPLIHGSATMTQGCSSCHVDADFHRLREQFQ